MDEPVARLRVPHHQWLRQSPLRSVLDRASRKAYTGVEHGTTAPMAGKGGASRVSEDTAVIVVTCPECGQRMKAPAGVQGKVTNCVKCGCRFQVSGENSSLAQAPRPAAARPPSSAIAQMLLKNELATAEQIREAEAVRAERGGTLYGILITLGHLDGERFQDVMSSQGHVASIGLSNYSIVDDVLPVIPREFAMERLALPIDKLGKLLSLAMVCPIDRETIEEAQRISGMRINPVLCGFDDLMKTFERVYQPTEESGAEADFSWLGNLSKKRDEEGAADLGGAGKQAPAATAPAPPAQEVEVAEPPAPEQPTQESPQAVSDRAEAGAQEVLERRQKVADFLSRVESLPVSPQTLECAQTASEDPHFPVRDLAAICGTDPPVVARLLSVANSAAYGMPERVDNANLATTILGSTGTVSVIKTCASVPPLSSEARFDQAAFLLDSRFCAAAAQTIAKASGKAPAATAFTAGLLHEIGLLALAVVFPEEFGKLDMPSRGADRLRSERAHFGMAHPEAGFLLARNWRLPASIAQAIQHYRSLDQAVEAGGISAVLALASHMTENRGVGVDALALEEYAGVLEALDLDPVSTKQIFESTLTMFNV